MVPASPALSTPELVQLARMNEITATANTPETIELRLTSAAYGGTTLGRLPDGRAVFVPFALPGERVLVRLRDEKRGHAQAELVEVLEAAGERIPAPCPHFGLCGGCHYQHLAYPEQLKLKTAILGEQLSRLGGLSQPPVRPCVPSPKPFHYRNTVQFHLTAAGQLGFVQADNQAIFPVESCLLPETAINEVWPQLDFEDQPTIERIGLRLGVEDDLQIILESDDLQPPEISVEGLPVSVAHLSPAGVLTLAGSPAVRMEISGRSFQVSAGSFFQVNRAMAATMVEHVLDLAQATPEMTILDVYCGVGLFSAFLAERAGRVIGIESSPSACEDFVENLDEFENVELYEATAEQALGQIHLQPELVVVDPPRAGIERRAMDSLLRLNSTRLIYISCDPATLGRDARRLSQCGYHLRQVTPFDLFPQTYHIESVSLWER